MNLHCLLHTFALLFCTQSAYITLPSYFILPNYPAPFTIYNNRDLPPFRPVPNIIVQNRNNHFYSQINTLLEHYSKLPRYGQTNTNYMMGSRNSILGMSNSLNGNDNFIVGYMNVLENGNKNMIMGIQN